MIAGRNPFDGIRDHGALRDHVVAGFECLLRDRIGCDLIGHLSALRPEDRWGSTANSLLRLKRHQWFRGIPWEDFATGHISVLLPKQSSARRSRGRLVASLPAAQTSWDGKNPQLRVTTAVRLTQSQGEGEGRFGLEEIFDSQRDMEIHSV